MMEKNKVLGVERRDELAAQVLRDAEQGQQIVKVSEHVAEEAAVLLNKAIYLQMIKDDAPEIRSVVIEMAGGGSITIR